MLGLLRGGPQPVIPWGITAMLPLALFPMLGVMSFKESAAIYCQSVLFLLLAIFLIGQAIKKHGSGERIALTFLSM